MTSRQTVPIPTEAEKRLRRVAARIKEVEDAKKAVERPSFFGSQSELDASLQARIASKQGGMSPFRALGNIGVSYAGEALAGLQALMPGQQGYERRLGEAQARGENRNTALAREYGAFEGARVKVPLGQAANLVGSGRFEPFQLGGGRTLGDVSLGTKGAFEQALDPFMAGGVLQAPVTKGAVRAGARVASQAAHEAAPAVRQLARSEVGAVGKGAGKAKPPAAESAVAKPARAADVPTGLAGAHEPPAVARAPQGEPSDLGPIARPGEFPESATQPTTPPGPSATAAQAAQPPAPPPQGPPPTSVAGGGPPAKPPVPPGGEIPLPEPPPIHGAPSGDANPIGLRPVVNGLTRSQRIANSVRDALHLGTQNEHDITTPIMAERARVRPIIESKASLLATRVQDESRSLFNPAKNGTIPSLSGVEKTLQGAPTIQDVAARYPTFKDALNPEQRAFIERIGAELQKYRRLMESQGIEVAGSRKDVMEGGYYIPRGNAAVGGVDEPTKIHGAGRTGVGKPGFLKTASFDSQAEGIAKGYEYPPLSQAVRSYVHQSGTKSADAYAARALKAATDAEGQVIAQPLSPEGVGRSENVINLAGLEGQVFPTEMANAANKVLRNEGPATGKGSALIRGVNTLNSWYRGVRATGDDSALMIQGLLAAGADQKAAAQAWKVNFKAWGTGGERVLAKYIADFDRSAQQGGRLSADQWTTQGLHIGGAETEFTLGQGLGKVGRLPGIRAANRAFGYTGDVLRLKWADDELAAEIHGLGPLRKPRTFQEIKASGDLDRIADAANKMTGWSPNRAAGDVGDVLLFAPRYFQARLETVSKAALSLRPGGATLDRRMARKALLKTAAWGTLLTVAANEALGNETDFRPVVQNKQGQWQYNTNFMRIRWNGRDWSIFGPWDSLARIIVNTGLGVQNPKAAFQSWEAMLSGVVGIPLDVAQLFARGYGGEEVTPLDLAKLFLEDLVPFGAGEIGAFGTQAAKGVAEGDAAEVAKGVGSEVLTFGGTKSSPLTKEERGATSSAPARPFGPGLQRTPSTKANGKRFTPAGQGRRLQPAGAR